MALYEIDGNALRAHQPGSFADLGLYERGDLQRLLREQPDALGEELLIVAEEFGRWEDARRRIDLLALDRNGCLVVVELKRTDDGGHMELQALRYAAMVSSMGFDDVLDTYTAHRAKHGGTDPAEARADLEGFLESAAHDENDTPVISPDVRILLVSADFGREITTAVLWLNRFDGMDIRCVRLVPYSVDGRILLDIQQVIPLPEAADYQVRLRRKDVAIKRAAASSDGRDFTRYQVLVDGQALPATNKRNTVRVMVDQLVRHGAPLADIAACMAPRKLRALPGVLTDPQQVASALQAGTDRKVDLGRWFTEHAWADQTSGTTWVLFKMWGLDTEPVLHALAAKFPDTGVAFQVAADDEQ